MYFWLIRTNVVFWKWGGIRRFNKKKLTWETDLGGERIETCRARGLVTESFRVAINNKCNNRRYF